MVIKKWGIVAAAGAMCLASAANAALVHALPPAAGSTESYAQGLDAAGQVVGYSRDGLTDAPTLWRPAAGGYGAETLPLTPGAASGAANAIGAGGAIVGYMQPADLSSATATVWTAPPGGTYAASPLPSPSGSAITTAYAVNASGAAVGYRENASGETAAVVWNPTGGTYGAALLPTPAGWLDTAATTISGSGDVGGYRFMVINNQIDVQGVVWQNIGAGAYTPKTIIATETVIPTAATNDAGIGAGVIGNEPAVIALFDGDYYAFELPQPFGTTDGAANAVNAHDAIAGYLKDPETATSGPEAALWLPTESFWELVNLDRWLNETDATLGSQWTLTEAFGLTDSWLVTGDGLYDPDGPSGPLVAVQRGFVLDASGLVPEPSAGAIVVMAAALLLERRRRR
jgi:hypothetical protein